MLDYGSITFNINLANDLKVEHSFFLQNGLVVLLWALSHLQRVYGIVGLFRPAKLSCFRSPSFRNEN